MPELDIIAFTVCETNRNFSMFVRSRSEDKYYEVSYRTSNPGPYYANWKCECKGFQYHGYCKHIDEAAKERCGWNESAFIGSGDWALYTTCPKCKGPTYTIRTGI